MNREVTLVKEIHVEQRDDEHSYIIDDGAWYEPYTGDRGRLFRTYQKEYGRCVSKVYRDGPNGTAKPIGWVFERREQYEDSGRYGRKPQYYTRAVWVELAPDALAEGL